MYVYSNLMDIMCTFQCLTLHTGIWEENSLCYFLPSLHISLTHSRLHHPLSDVALLMHMPFSSVLCAPCPVGTPIHVEIVPPSPFLTSPSSLACPGLPFCKTFCPPVVFPSCQVTRPSPFCFLYFLYDVFNFGSVSYFRASNLITQSDVQHFPFHSSLCWSQLLFQIFGCDPCFAAIGHCRQHTLVKYPFSMD